MLNKIKRVAGRCIFCNGFKLSKEHIWSDWLTTRGLVPEQKAHVSNTILCEIDHFANTANIMPSMPRERQGTLIQRKIRNVCVKCNNGWMSVIVDSAIPYAEPLLVGIQTTINAEAQKHLSAWIALSCIMAEFTDPPTISIPKSDREFLMADGAPPTDWQIFIGRYEGSDWFPTSYRHHGARFALARGGPFDMKQADVHDYQVSTYVLGGLAVHVASSTYAPAMDTFAAQFAPQGMQRIWPPVDSSITWPPPAILGDAEMNFLADAFNNFKIRNRQPG